MEDQNMLDQSSKGIEVTARTYLESSNDRLFTFRPNASKIAPMVLAFRHLLPKSLDREYVTKDKFNYYRFKLRQNETFLASLAVITLVFGMIEWNIYFKNDNQGSKVTDAIRIINIWITLWIMVLIIRCYTFKLRYLIYRKVLAPNTGLFSVDSLYPRFLLEMLTMVVVSLPWVDVTFEFEQLDATVTYSLDGLIVAFQFLRLYTVIRLFRQYTPWTSWKTRFYMKKADKIDYIFAMKWYLKTHPYKTIMFILSISIIICGFLLFIFERPMPDTEFDTLYNCLWVVFITISTIGYGEMVPTSHFGRVVVVVACIWGSFLLSLIVVIFQEQTQLTKEEELFYNDTVIKHDIIPVIRPYAILFIQRFFKLKQARKAKSPANPRFQLHCLESEAKDTFKRMRLAKTPSGEINIKESLKGTQDVQYKIERLRVRGENFTHGADQLLTALEFYAKEQQNAAAKYQSYCDSTVRLTNLLGSALTGKSKPVEVEDFLRIPTVSKLCRQNRLEASLRRKSSLHQIAADSQRRSVLQRNRGYERGSILVSQTLELSEFAKKIQTMEEELKNRSGSDSDVISESAFTSNIHSNAQGSLEDIELHDRNEPEAEGELRQMDRRRNQNQEDQGEDHEIDYNE